MRFLATRRRFLSGVLAGLAGLLCRSAAADEAVVAPAAPVDEDEEVRFTYCSPPWEPWDERYVYVYRV